MDINLIFMFTVLLKFSFLCNLALKCCRIRFQPISNITQQAVINVTQWRRGDVNSFSDSLVSYKLLLSEVLRLSR